MGKNVYLVFFFLIHLLFILNPDLFCIFQTETALMYDAVQLFAKALQDLDGSKSIIDFPPISCDSGLRGLDGSSIINFMKPVS